MTLKTGEAPVGRLSLQRWTWSCLMVLRLRKPPRTVAARTSPAATRGFLDLPGLSENLASASRVPRLCRLRMTAMIVVTRPLGVCCLAHPNSGTQGGSLWGAQRCGGPGQRRCCFVWEAGTDWWEDFLPVFDISSCELLQLGS